MLWRPGVGEVGSCEEFEEAARLSLGEVARDYIFGGEADTIEHNRGHFASLQLRPRVLMDVSAVDTSCSLFGAPCRVPFYLSSVAQGKLVSSSGEATFVRAAAKGSAAYIVPFFSSVSYDEVWGAAAPGQRLPFQLYLVADEPETFRRLRLALDHGASAVVVTVDANAPRQGAFANSTMSTVGAFPSPKLTWARLEDRRTCANACTRTRL